MANLLSRILIEAQRRFIIMVSLVDMSLEVEISLVEAPIVVMVGRFRMH